MRYIKRIAFIVISCLLLTYSNYSAAQNNCQPKAIPFAECFDSCGVEGLELPACWVGGKSSASYPFPRLSAEQALSGTHSLMLGYTYLDNQVSAAFTPELDTTDGSLDEYYISFWAYTSSSYTSLWVNGVADTTLNVGTHIIVQPDKKDGWIHYQFPLAGCPYGATRIMFMLMGTPLSEDTATLFIDNIHLSKCLAPNFTLIGPNTIQATLDNNDTLADYYIVYGPKGFAQDSLTRQDYTRVHVTANPWIIDNLRGTMEYDFYTQCSDSDSALMMPAMIVTNIAYSAPQCALTDTASIQYTFGSYGNPYLLDTLINFGSADSNSVHTYHFDTQEFAPFTDNQLTTVPPGRSQSIRLGNWKSTDDAESVSYTFAVDTANADILYIDYALVAQGTYHPGDSARLFVELIPADTTVIPFDSVCGYIILDSSNLSQLDSSCYWRGWSHLGLNLRPYQGNSLKFRVTHRDQGFAYIDMYCSQSVLFNYSCGDTLSPTFHASDGFDYVWTNSTGDTISIESNMMTDTAIADTLYYCQFVQKNNPACSFTRAIANRYFVPEASFHIVVDTIDCYYMVKMVNDSRVIDAQGEVYPDQAITYNYWTIDTAHTHFGTHYTDTLDWGEYTVTLITGYLNQCFDTLTIPLSLARPAELDTIYSWDTICHAVAYNWGHIDIPEGELLGPMDTLLVDSLAYRCETPRAMHLHVYEEGHISYYDTITVYLCYDSTYMFNEETAIDEPGEYDYSIKASNGCDSNVHVHVLFEPCCIDQLEFPNVVTPNGDGLNDIFSIKALLEQQCYPYNELSIYDRTGRQVYHATNIHDISQWWDPKRDKAPCGTYFYYFKARKFDNTNGVERKGVIEVLSEK